MLDKIKQAFKSKGPVEHSLRDTDCYADNLLAWWETEFSPEEQNYILTKYKPMTLGGAVEGERTDLSHIIRPDGSLGSISSLTALSTWFLTGDDVPLARRILAKAVERRESETGSVVDRHFIYGLMIKVYYRDRNRDNNALELAIETCQKQIAIAPQAIREWPEYLKGQDGGLPAHSGFEQLAIILERNKDYQGAIQLSQKALSQGWAGDWEKRIARCRKRSKR